MTNLDGRDGSQMMWNQPPGQRPLRHFDATVGGGDQDSPRGKALPRTGMESYAVLNITVEVADQPLKR